MFHPSPEFCAHKDFCGSGPGIALLQCERKGRGSRRFVPESHPDRDGGSSLSQGKKFWLHRTGIKTGVFWASLCLHQVCSLTSAQLFKFLTWVLVQLYVVEPVPLTQLKVQAGKKSLVAFKSVRACKPLWDSATLITAFKVFVLHSLSKERFVFKVDKLQNDKQPKFTHSKLNHNRTWLDMLPVKMCTFVWSNAVRSNFKSKFHVWLKRLSKGPACI